MAFTLDCVAVFAILKGLGLLPDTSSIGSKDEEKENIAYLFHVALQKALNTDEVKSDGTMTESTNSVINMIEEFRNTPVDKSLVEKVLKIQNLVHEISA